MSLLGNGLLDPAAAAALLGNPLLPGSAPGPATKTPDQVAGLDYWLDASDAATVTLGTPPDVSDLDDKSATAWHLTQTFLSRRPELLSAEVNGRDGIQFDGVDDHLFRTGITPWSDAQGEVFFVFRPDTVSAAVNATLFCLARSSDNNTGFLFMGPRGPRSSVNTAAIGMLFSEAYADTALVAGNVYLVHYRSDGAAYTMELDGLDDGLNFSGSGTDTGNWFDTIANDNQIALGSWRRAAGPTWSAAMTFFEMAKYNVVLSADDRTALVDGLKAKWGIT